MALLAVLGPLELVYTLIILLISSDNTNCQCHLGNSNTETSHALVGASYESFTARNYSECLTRCVRSTGCKSLNFLLVNGTCELNSETKNTRPDLYVRRINSIYTTKTAYHLELTWAGMSTSQSPTAHPTNQSPTTQSTTTDPPTTQQTTMSPTTQSLATDPPTTQPTTLSPTTQSLTTQAAQVSYPRSCLEILMNGSSVGDGVYSIDPEKTGIPMQAYCDMTTDGGGWTIIKRTIFQTSTPPQNKRFQTYEVISEFNSNDLNIFPTADAVLDIKNTMGFHQIYYYCRKQSVGRVVSIRTRNNTAGHQVVRYFTDAEFAMTNFVAACDSFDRLPEDTSVLSQNCAMWNKNTGTWGKNTDNSRTLTTAFFIKGSNAFGCYVDPPKVEFCACDDYYLAPLPYNSQDRWQISVR